MTMIKTHFGLAKKAIKKNKMRSFLTCLGIAIGVASIVLIFSLTGGVSKMIERQVTKVGENLLIVRPETEKDLLTDIVDELTIGNTLDNSNLEYGDIKTIQDIDGVKNVAPVVVAIDTVKSEKNEIKSVNILGTNKDFINIQPLEIKTGSFWTDEKSNTAVVGRSLSLLLFNTTNPIGKIMTIRGERFVVMGVLEEIEESINVDNIDFNNSVLVSYESLSKINNNLQIRQIDIKAAEGVELGDLADKINNKLQESKKGECNFVVAYGDEISHPASLLLSIITNVLITVAGISLVVGGIGVMNIMLVSVAERTHEIGVRKSVGASSRNILMQFMFESLILTFCGGILGIILGYVLAFLISIILPFEPFISWMVILMVFIVTILVGVVFGIYPAIKAASKSPIESLKHYR